MFKQVIGGHLMFLLDNIMLQMLLQATQQLVRATNQRSRASFRPNPFLLQAHSLLLHQSEPQPKPEEPLPPQVAESHPSRAMAQFPYFYITKIKRGWSGDFLRCYFYLLDPSSLEGEMVPVVGQPLLLDLRKTKRRV